MQQIFLYAAIALCLLILVSLYRVVVGPTVLDRIVGGNVIGAKTPILLLLIGDIYGDIGMFVDIALAYALLNFIASLGATKFFLRQQSVQSEDETAIGKETL
jgi:multicomponent Na+:H+ antiporter subunit F